MKSLWKIFPAWVMAIVYGLILLIPTVILNQTVVALNASIMPETGASLLIVIGILFGYWKLTTKLNPYKKEGDIELTFKESDVSFKGLRKILGLMGFTISLIFLFAMLFDIDNTKQIEYISSFKEYPVWSAIPMLLAIALSAGFVEEISFRGYVQNVMNRSYARVASYFIIGLIFAVIHMLPWVLVLPYMLASIGYSWVADQTKSIGVPIIAHASVDFVAFVCLYFGVLDPFLNEPSLSHYAIMGSILIVSTALIIPESSFKSSRNTSATKTQIEVTI